MRIFGKERQSLRVKNIRAARALYMDGPGTEEIEIEFVTDTGERLTLQMRPQLAHKLNLEVGSAYEAICPPLIRGSNYATWDGMQSQ